MNKSSQACQGIRLLCAVMVMALIGSTACSRQLGAQGLTSDSKGPQLPFNRVSDQGGVSPTEGFALDEIPAGTQLKVRLQQALSSASARAGESFPAVLDDPVILGGRTIVPRGALVAVSVSAAKAAKEPNDPGYLRLTVISMMVNGKAIPLRTASVFAKGGSYPSSPLMNPSTLNSANGMDARVSGSKDDVQFSTGHRLTFRLAQPFHSQS